MRKPIIIDNFFRVANDPIQAARFLIQFAGEAPSSHNTQPWIFKVLPDGAIEVHGDPKRKLLLSDPESREFFVSIGCAIENVIVAADYYGLPLQVSYFPDPARNLFAAKFTFESFVAKNEARDPHHLIFEIAKRHANREPFQKDKPIPEEFLKKIGTLEKLGCIITPVSDGTKKAALAKIAGDATFAAFKDKGFCKELSEWIKPSFPNYSDGMPGYNLGIPWPISFIVPLAIRYADVATQQRTMVDVMVEATPLFIVISTESNEPRDWVSAGQFLERMWLMASREGIKMGLLGAPIEIGNFHAALQDVLATSSRPQLFCRLGYANAVPPQSPRRSLEQITTS